MLADYPKHEELNGKSVAEIADRVPPALTEAMSLLKAESPAEADNFRSTPLWPAPTRARHAGSFASVA